MTKEYHAGERLTRFTSQLRLDIYQHGQYQWLKYWIFNKITTDLPQQSFPLLRSFKFRLCFVAKAISQSSRSA